MDIRPVAAPQVLELVNSLEAALRQFAFEEGITADFQLPEEQLCVKLPEELQPLMDDSVLSVLAKRFSIASDEGPFEMAMNTGETVLAIYLCIYPAYYPQIGSHIRCTVSPAHLSPRFPSPRNGEGGVERVHEREQPR